MSQQSIRDKVEQKKQHSRRFDRTPKTPTTKAMSIIANAGYGLTLLVIVLFMLSDVVFTL
ncbi:hypothetical protein [Vibrio scophthalmi]|uniref:Uncharacterized protein n=1 Tax=Vibrio scophthalmi LMG 19158 TaxID=870967 RepID=F9RV43_9VIBR|nr:hypothetical protein [Vibrio scophthalmi]EGU29767.1 hypothetical protein VIS19158_16101 [Vibrio scophthalmi LMG 19158]